MTSQNDQTNGYSGKRESGHQNGNTNHVAKGDGQGEDGTTRRYPLSDRPDLLRAASGRSLDEISLDAASQGDLSAQDLQIGADTLLAQAEIARRAGYGELADNLTRAAELTAVPNQELLRMYEMLRPHRSTYEELNELAHTLVSRYDAKVTAGFVREAAQVYQTRNLLRRA